MNLEIKIKEGLGDIKFNMPVEEVIAILGEASDVESIDNAADESTTVLHYADEGLTIFFEGENPILSCIDISNEDCTLFGKEIFNMNEKEISKFLIENKYFEQDMEDEAWGERRVTFIEGNIDFFFDNNELVSIQFGK